MAIGIQQTGQDINAWAGKIALEVEMTMVQIQHMQAFLVATPDTTLEAAPYSLAAGDVSTLKSAFTDLNTLANIYLGTASQTTPYDFRTFSKQLRGASCW